MPVISTRADPLRSFSALTRDWFTGAFSAPTQAQVEAIKDRLIAHPEMRRATVAVWSTARRLLLEAQRNE